MSFRKLSLIVAFAATVLWGPIDTLAQEPVSREYQLKAAYLTKFLNFIEWKSGYGAEPKRSICILGDNPFGDSIEVLASAYKMAVDIRELRGASEADGCHLVYVSRSENSRLAPILETLNASGPVTVSDIAGFAERGGTIELIVQGRHVRFVINQRQATQSKFRLSSQLLALAKDLLSLLGGHFYG